MRRVATVPNLLSGARLVLAPVFLWLYAEGQTTRALAVFAVAAATDLLDGIAARALDQRTALGAVLDPVADKVLAACALFALAARGRLPLWLPVLDACRDAAQLAGAAYLHAAGRDLEVHPTRVGKYATAWLAVTVVLGLAADFGADAGALAPWTAAAGMVAAACLAISWGQYFLAFRAALRGAAPSGPPGAASR